ncbi:MAG: hypothetical protein DRO87_11330 [Candidatus Thorarchaeota archaeon]|nr:MAG: hypothetical protein DRO87_11330 [Candidatus Thorarchaeota archaeon]
MDTTELLFKLPTAMIVCFGAVAIIMPILFPPTKILWSQRGLLDKVVRVTAAGIVLFICLTLGTILLP